ncbi:MAG: glycoside hydrolase family 127 protein, partial [Chloroflexales bacterium]|nr:glycoside hydrolase family 127 protein [Chloroflexales bacterium]
LLRQLRVQAAGLSGHLDEFWPDVARSSWIGGDAEGWERGPYWLDGFVPLAFLLNDERLVAKAHHWVNEILARQGDDGWLGPVQDATDSRRVAHDPWPVFVALKALAQYHEATSDPRIMLAMARFLRMLDELLDRQPLFDWGRYRWPDLALPIYWLYERTREGWLLDLAAKSYRQSFDWGAHFAAFPASYQGKQRLEQVFPPKPPAGCTFALDHASHVVNNAMGIKQPGVWYRLSGNTADRDAARAIIATLDRYHGQANGTFSGDEHLAGTSPAQGTELCAVVEYMFSLETLAGITGDAALGDRLEQLAFNALPATFTPDMWAHQYVQQANQVQCVVTEDRVYTNNGPDANIYGLEPNFGCCTANMHQGWPKLASSLWMRSADDGLAAVAYAPCAVRATIGGVPLELETITDYPFGDSIRIVVRAERPVRFPLHLRVPAWAEGATARIGDAGIVALKPGDYHREEREWFGETAVTLRLPMAVRAERRHNGSVALHYGPLLLALNVAATWRQLRGDAP